ncbi:MAG: cation transporter [Bifidobacteriaceae bacterium]|jgi:copper chaperone CopZ|nr:cation transporter [Bifidobacteriaceae bacterium]
MKTIYQLSGLTCKHCVKSVTEAFAAIPEVKSVSVKLVSGGVSQVKVTSSALLPTETVAQVVDEAGYQLADVK